MPPEPPPPTRPWAAQPAKALTATMSTSHSRLRAAAPLPATAVLALGLAGCGATELPTAAEAPEALADPPSVLQVRTAETPPAAPATRVTCWARTALGRPEPDPAGASPAGAGGTGARPLSVARLCFRASAAAP